MKIYIIIDEYLNSEYHSEYVDCFADAEEALEFVTANQSDGHKLKLVCKEFADTPTNQNRPFVVPTTPQPLDPLKPGDTYPLGITWQWMPCMNGGPCTNPQHDCVNCPRPYGDGGYYTTTGTGDNRDINLIREHKTTSCDTQ